MKYFLAEYKLYDGEHEHMGSFTIEAKDEEKADEIANTKAVGRCPKIGGSQAEVGGDSGTTI